MNQKNKKYYLLLILILVLQLSLTACSSDPYLTYINDDLNKTIKADGVEFLMDKSELEAILGSSYETSPCVYGYELGYNDLNLIVGINNDDVIRKLIIKNENYSALSIHIGDSKSDATQLLEESGFSKENSDMYINEFISVKLLSKDSIVTGIILEKIES